MDEAVILSALQVAVTAAVAASTMPGLPVSYVALPFDVPSDGKYLENVFIPANPSDRYWGDEKDYQGMFRLVLHWPNDGSDPYGPLDVLGSICSYFTKGGLLNGKVQVLSKPSLTGSPLPQGNETLYPASFRYQCFVGVVDPLTPITGRGTVLLTDRFGVPITARI